jgi:hypothetical protein
MASLVEIPKIIKKDVSTSCFDLIDDSNPCNQVLVKNVVIDTCSDNCNRNMLDCPVHQGTVAQRLILGGTGGEKPPDYLV